MIIQNGLNKKNVFTSTGIKLLHHPSAVTLIQQGLGTPLSVQISPTSKCNLNCVFCSNINRHKDELLELTKIKTLLKELLCFGLRAVEWTGGGDPTLYPEINEAIDFTDDLGLQQGFITNGLALKYLQKTSLEKLKWIRISMNCLDYVDSIWIPDLPKTTIGFSYVINEKTSNELWERLHILAKKYNPAYVRIVPNCQSTWEQQIHNNSIYADMVSKWGDPYFYQIKEFGKSDKCWWGYFKPFVNHDNFVYRCSSVVLNKDAERTFHEKYRWCSIEELPEKYKVSMEPFDTNQCNQCVFKPQNDIINSLINPNGMENFI